MSATDVMNNYEVEHIGSEPHLMRNAILALSVVILAGLIGLFYQRLGREKSAAASELQQFHQAMFNRCGGDQFQGAPEPKLVELYAGSSRMRSAVVQQFHQLQRPTTSCEDVRKALRSADYPIR
jgi:hypothetical protein